MEQEIRAVERMMNMIVDFVVKYSFQIAGGIIVLVASDPDE